MAYKDEYEVARLSLKRDATEKIYKKFDGPVQIMYCFHPPALRWILKKKVCFGPWFRFVLAVLQFGKYFRGSLWDPFGKTKFRKTERALIDWYSDLLIQTASRVTAINYEKFVALVSKVDEIRGYEDIKESASLRVQAECNNMLNEL